MGASFSAYVTKWLKPSDCCGFLTPQGMPQIPILLQSKPKVCRYPQGQRQLQRCIRCDTNILQLTPAPITHAARG